MDWIDVLNGKFDVVMQTLQTSTDSVLSKEGYDKEEKRVCVNLYIIALW